jgi:DNA-directed RNA polymerase sigma subunit (sigma70/sigma32)
MKYFSLTGLDGERIQSSQPNQLDYLIQKETGQALARALRSLPARERLAIKARFGFPGSPTVNALAAALDCSRQAVYQLVNAGISHLLEPLLQGGFDCVDH